MKFVLLQFLIAAASFLTWAQLQLDIGPAGLPMLKGQALLVGALLIGLLSLGPRQKRLLQRVGLAGLGLLPLALCDAPLAIQWAFIAFLACLEMAALRGRLDRLRGLTAALALATLCRWALLEGWTQSDPLLQGVAARLIEEGERWRGVALPQAGASTLALGCTLGALVAILTVSFGRRSWLALGALIPWLGALFLPLFLLPEAGGVHLAQDVVVGLLPTVSVGSLSFALSLTLARTLHPLMSTSGATRRLVLPALLVLPIAGLPALEWVSASTAAGEGWSPRVVVMNRGGFDWRRPQFGQFGSFSGGMFGLLPEELRGRGLEVDVLERDRVREEDLDTCHLFVLINCGKTWDDAERRVIDTFVRSGRSLLVLGDHTDVFGCMRGLNPLLAPYGMQFRFDSAYQPDKSFAGSVQPATHYSLQGTGFEGPGAAIGASLELQYPAQPLWMARYGHSDAGVRENIPGAFLGNYSVDPGERLGDLPLVAWAPVGAGQVVVFGDTTPFQNGSCSHWIGGWMGPFLSDLTLPVAWWRRPLVRVAILATAALMLLFLLRVWPGLAGPLGFASLLVVLSVQAAVRPHQPIPFATPEAPVAVIAHSTVMETGHHEVGGNTIGPAYGWLQRSGYLLRDDRDGPRSAIWERAQVLTIVAPRRPLAEDDAAQMLRNMEAGQRIVVATDHEGGRHMAPLLGQLGLGIRALGLGPLPKSAKADPTLDETPRFLDGYPLDLDPSLGPEQVEVGYRYGEHVLIAFRKVGLGGLILIGDPRWFSTRNQEGSFGHLPGNQHLLYLMTQRWLGVSAPPAVPFPDPPATGE